MKNGEDFYNNAGLFEQKSAKKAVKIIRYKIKGNATTIVSKMFGYTF